MSETIYTQEVGKYHVQKTVGGWTVVYISDRNTARPVDSSRIYPSRQNAYARARQLNAPDFTVYERPIDYGNGFQRVLVQKGEIVEQTLHAHQGYYTGDGNPEWVHRSVSVLRGLGFKRVRSRMTTDELELEYLQRQLELE